MVNIPRRGVERHCTLRRRCLYEGLGHGVVDLLFNRVLKSIISQACGPSLSKF
jgi:hypothetical protein